MPKKSRLKLSIYTKPRDSAPQAILAVCNNFFPDRSPDTKHDIPLTGQTRCFASEFLWFRVTVAEISSTCN